MVGRHPKGESPYTERSASLSGVLRDQRVKVLKISRVELSARSGVSSSNIQAIETGRTQEPGLFTVIALAVALNLDLGHMMKTVAGPIRPAQLHTSTADGMPDRLDQSQAD